MTLYFSHPCATGKSSPVCTDWHSVYPQIAVSCENGCVSIFQDEVLERSPHCQLMFQAEKQDTSIRRENPATSLRWHPQAKILAIGWQDGKITIWNEDAKAIKEPESPHDSRITLLEFDDQGSRLITGDEKGTVILWNLDMRSGGILQRLQKFQRDGLAQTRAHFRRTNRDLMILFGGDKGNMYIADEKGSCKQSITLGEFSPLAWSHYWK